MARLRGRILVLSLIALLFLVLAAQAEPSRVVQAEEILKKVELGQPVKCENVVIEQNLTLSGIVTSPIEITDSVVLGIVNFKETYFLNKVCFEGTQFKGPVYSRGAYFNQTTDFRYAQFNQIADFRSTHFNQSASFQSAHFNQASPFSDAHFNQAATFSSAYFNQIADFKYAVFSQEATFWSADFNQAADFSRVRFNQTSTFSDAHFNQSASFSGAFFNQSVAFLSAYFDQTTSFWEVRFNQTASFFKAHFNQPADFSKVQFNQTTSFDDTHFKRGASFRSAHFNKTTSFSEAHFDQIADFGDAQFNQEAHFEDAYFRGVFFNNGQFSKEAFFDGARIEGILSLYRTKYDKLNIRWSSISDLAYDDTAYYLLIENFKKQGFTDDVNDCYFAYRCKHRLELWRQGKFDNWFFDLLAWATYGYGLRPVWPLGWSMLFILLGGAFFFVTKSISRSKGPETPGKRLRAIRGKDSPPRAGEVSIWEALLLSATYFTSGASSIISSVPQEFSPLGRSRYVVVILRLLGWVFFVLFLTSLGKIA